MSEAGTMRLAVAFQSAGGFSGGARKTLLSLVPRLREHPRIESLEVFLPRQAERDPDLTDLRTRFFRAGRFGSGNLRQHLRRYAPDVVFVPNAAHPGRCGSPVVVMVRNVEPIVAPVGHNPPGAALRNLARADRARRACLRADRIIAVSNYVRDLVAGRWNLPTERIGVVYHGVNPIPAEAEYPRPPAVPDDALGRYWLAVGSMVAYRGLEDSVQALASRVGQNCDEHLLVAGADVYGPDYRRRIAELAKRNNLPRRVHFLGQLPRDQLAWCYLNTLGLLMTSRLEACPNVAMEAMSAGCDIIATDRPPMPELLGTTARYYPPGHIDTLADHMQQLRLSSPQQTEARAIQRRQRAEHFSWQRCCERTVEELHHARSLFVPPASCR